jgi:hypothetical protein
MLQYWLHSMSMRASEVEKLCDLVRHSGLIPTEQRTLAALTPQNGEKLIASLGTNAGIVQFTTNLGSFFNVLRHGGEV